MNAKLHKANAVLPFWAQGSVKIPVPALAAMLFAAVFLPSYFIITGNSRAQKQAIQLASTLSAMTQPNTNVSQTVEALSTSRPVYSPDLATYSTTASLLTSSNKELFNILSFASQFASTKELFSDANIIIIKLPALTQFNNTGEQLFSTGDTLQQAAGFYR